MVSHARRNYHDANHHEIDVCGGCISGGIVFRRSSQPCVFWRCPMVFVKTGGDNAYLDCEYRNPKNAYTR
jgi:hypothetical protein